MNRLKTLLLTIGLLSLFAASLYSCGGETSTPISPAASGAPSPTPVAGTLSTLTPGFTPGLNDAETRLGLATGVFENALTAPSEPVHPLQLQSAPKQFESTALGATQKLGPPAWVKPGMRITFYLASSTSSTADDGTPNSSGGEGLNQIDVVAVEGTDVVLATTTFSTNRTDRQYAVAAIGGGKTAGDVVDSVWIHPTRLAELAEMDLGDTKVGKGDYTVEGVTYSVVSFVTNKTDFYDSYAYDIETGLLVSATTKKTVNNSTQIYITRLLGYRQRNVPGLGRTNPAWVAKTPQLKYSGTWSFVNPYAPNDPAITYPMTYTVTLGKGGKTWVPFTTKSVIRLPSLKQESSGSGISTATGGYWFDPAALAKLKKGQVIDVDAHSEERVTVDSINRSSAVKTVTISSEIPGVTTLVTYDLTTGAMVNFQTSSSGTGITITLKLQNPPK